MDTEKKMDKTVNSKILPRSGTQPLDADSPKKSLPVVHSWIYKEEKTDMMD